MTVGLMDADSALYRWGWGIDQGVSLALSLQQPGEMRGARGCSIRAVYRGIIVRPYLAMDARPKFKIIMLLVCRLYCFGKTVIYNIGTNFIVQQNIF